MELPKYFIERTQAILQHEWNNFVDALQADVPTSIRVNTKKYTSNINLQQVPWSQTGYYLAQRPQFTFDPLLHAGAYYVQEASSMFIEQAIRQLVDGDIRALDLCAAPGGKSTLISSLLSEGSLLVSNEIIRSRANILAENLMKWGNPNIIISNNKPGDFANLNHFFDLILVDAPCSGEGMFRKDPQAIDEWSVDNVKLCAERQKNILSAIWDTLKPNGYLLYSTCTYNKEENEDIVQWLHTTHNASVIELNINEQWNITESKVCNKSTYHFYPHKTKGEGFYFAVLQKADEEIDAPIFRQRKDKKAKKSNPMPSEYLSYLKEKEKFTLLDNQDFIYGLPINSFSDLQILQNHLRIIHQGVCIGQVKGKDLIPNQSLALNNCLNKNSFEIEEIDWQTAISFLRRETVTLKSNTKGYILLTYKDMPIGFAKNLENRANNLYPNEWRIRSGNIPADTVSVID